MKLIAPIITDVNGKKIEILDTIAYVVIYRYKKYPPEKYMPNWTKGPVRGGLFVVTGLTIDKAGDCIINDEKTEWFYFDGCTPEVPEGQYSDAANKEVVAIYDTFTWVVKLEKLVKES